MSSIQKLLELKQMLDSGSITVAEYTQLKNNLFAKEEVVDSKKSIGDSSILSNSVNQNINNSIKKSTISSRTRNTFIITSIVLVGFYIFYDKGLINLNSLHNIDDRKLVTQQDLNEYALNEANDLCGSWKAACNHNNETERWNKQLFVDGLINNFELDGLSRAIQRNDLPNSYFKEADEIFKKAIEDCGWTYERSKWPGQK